MVHKSNIVLQVLLQNADFSQTNSFIITIVENVLQNGLKKGVVLNVNFPKISKEKIKGIKICRQAKSYWEESLINELVRLEKITIG